MDAVIYLYGSKVSTLLKFQRIKGKWLVKRSLKIKTYWLHSAELSVIIWLLLNWQYTDKENQDFLPSSQKSITGSSPEPVQFNSYASLKTHFNITVLSMPRPPNWSIPLRLSIRILCQFVTFPIHKTTSIISSFVLQFP